MIQQQMSQAPGLVIPAIKLGQFQELLKIF